MSLYPWWRRCHAEEQPSRYVRAASTPSSLHGSVDWVGFSEGAVLVLVGWTSSLPHPSIFTEGGLTHAPSSVFRRRWVVLDHASNMRLRLAIARAGHAAAFWSVLCSTHPFLQTSQRRYKEVLLTSAMISLVQRKHREARRY